MAWQLLAAALPAAAKVAGTALSKPREEDYKPQTDYMKKYLSYLRGRTADREVAHLAMQPALRVAGKQGRQMQRQVGYDVARAGLEGSGIESQMRLSAGQQTQDALATATDKAVAAQAAETARVGEKAAGITAQIQTEEARADQAFKTAESQWKRQLASDVIGGVASVASAGISQYGQNIAGFRQALTEGSVPAGTTYSQFKEMAKSGVMQGAPELGVQKAELGKMSPAEYAQYIGASKERISGLRVAENIYGGSEKIKELRAKGFSDDYIISEAQRLQGAYVSQVGQGADPRLVSEALGLSGMGNYSAPAAVTTDPATTTTVTTDPVTTDPVTTDPVPTKEQKQKLVDEAGDKAYKETYARLKAEKDSTRTEPVDVEEKYGKELDKVYDDTYRATKGKLAGDFATEPVETEVKLPKDFKEGDYNTYPIKEIEGVKYHYNPKTGDPVKTVKGEIKIQKIPSEMTDWEKHLKASGGKSKYFKNEEEFLAAQEKHKEKHKDKQLTEPVEKTKIKEEDSYKVQGFEDQPDYGVTVEALAPAKKGKRYKIERKGKEHSVIVTNVDKENKKVTLRDMVLNKEYKTSFDKFDEYRGATNMASKKIDPVFSAVGKFEGYGVPDSRSERHNNIGAVVWTENLQKKHPKMEKGDSFVDRDGVTRYTAKFPDKETGERINRQIMQDIFEEVGGDTAKFYARWSGLPENSKTVQNFVKEVGG
tara:strand:+ start:20382 stop:22514 length:2133 start_codon:yes stop_codon:yes gene_type:complete